MKKILFMLMGATLLTGCGLREHEETPAMRFNPQPYENVVVTPAVNQTNASLIDSQPSLIDISQNQQNNNPAYMETLAKKLRKELRKKAVLVREVDSQIDLIIPNKTAFGTNQGKIQSSFESVLLSISGLLKEYDQTMIQIIGYTDDSGSVLANNESSLQKADTIAEFLKSNGISSERIVTDGAGPQNPIANNKTPSGREQNRRVEITLINIQ